jgi:leucyl aminopeptidase
VRRGEGGNPLEVKISREPRLSKIEHLFLLVLEDQEPGLDLYPKEVRELAAKAIRRAGFIGRADACITILTEEGKPSKLTLIGLGKAKTFSIRLAKTALYGVGRIARRNRDTSIGVVLPYQLPKLSQAETVRLAAELLMQSDYRYDPYITVREEGKPPLIEGTLLAPSSLESRELKQISAEAEAVAAGIRTARDLGNGPGNEVTATRLANRAAEVSKDLGIRCTIYDKKQIEKMKMGGLLAVNRGSAEEPRFVVMEYTPKKTRQTVCLVGKGITFDSGGISIKPADRMEEMKFDMCGAAAVIGTIQAAASLELPVRLFGIIASTDNLPGGSAYKPGDIVTTMSGKTIEVVNTDAEGRVILSDALHYASTLKPDLILDYATLTGACVVALGSEASGLFTADDELARKLIQAGEKAGERLWRLPEWDDYKDLIRSDWADVKNSGGRWAGATTAAVFLKEFVGSTPWAHIDIAGTAWTENETAREPKGATGVGVRMTIELLKSLV